MPPAPTPQVSTILPSTTRWRPQRVLATDPPDSRDVLIDVGSSVELDTDTSFNVDVAGKDSAGQAVPTSTLGLMATKTAATSSQYQYQLKCNAAMDNARGFAGSARQVRGRSWRFGRGVAREERAVNVSDPAWGPGGGRHVCGRRASVDGELALVAAPTAGHWLGAGLAEPHPSPSRCPLASVPHLLPRGPRETGAASCEPVLTSASFHIDS